jgi:ATP-binding cassette subfamily B protein
VVVQVAVIAAIAVGAALALGGSVDVALVVALLVLAVRFVEPLIAVADVGSGLRISRNALERIDDLLRTPVLPEPATSAPTGAASVEFDHVAFSYTPGTPVLHDVSFTLQPATMTAVVGPSGSGKTTLTRLAARFYDVDSGAVRVAGADVRDLRTEDLMAQVSLVFQDVYLFAGSVLDTIRLGRPGATDEEVLAAARTARVDDVVATLPDGWHTDVGEGGARLSGGERQRLSIARALLKDAPIVLLDEATSALDPINEAAVLDGLRALTAERTVLVIAHRLQTVMSADEILVLDDGRIVERGIHDDLLRRDGRYAAFWRSRSRAAGWRLASSGAAS